MLLTPGASNGAFWPAVSVGAAETLMSVAPSAATAAPAAPRTVTQERMAMRRRCLIMAQACRTPRRTPGPPRWPLVTPGEGGYARRTHADRRRRLLQLR